MANSFSSKKTRSFNILDFILILLVIIMIVAGIATVVRSNPNNISGGDKKVTFTVQTAALPEALSSQLSIADKIYDDVTGQLLGTITNVEVVPYSYIGYAPDGTPVETPVSGKITIILTVSTTVWADGTSYSIDDYSIAIGKEMTFHSERAATSGVCTGITG